MGEKITTGMQLLETPRFLSSLKFRTPDYGREQLR